MDTNKYTAIRHALHLHPELSGREEHTARLIREQLAATSPTRLLTGIGGHGIVAEYRFSDDAPTLLFRADTDAVAIEEHTPLPYASRQPGVSHKCGHDGHTAILLAFAELLHAHPLPRGKAILLFQPSEEDGQGAARVLQHPFFRTARIDAAYALHNLPGYPLGSVVCRPGSFTCSVVSCSIHAEGQTSHAAEPEKAVSPAPALLELLHTATAWNSCTPESPGYFRATLVELHIGEEAYGVTAGSGVLRLTLRAATAQHLAKHTRQLENLVQHLQAQDPRLRFTLEWMESFTANENDPQAVETIRAAAMANALPCLTPPHPFTWGEDFGLFTQTIPGAMFGLGAGTGIPPLHTPDYDFPDELIPIGARLFHRIAQNLTGTPSR